MPIPSPEGQTPISYSLTNRNNSSNSDTGDFNSQLPGLSANSTHLQTQTPGGNIVRRWNRLRRRSPFYNNPSSHYHSLRARYFSSSAQSSHPNSRTERQLLHRRQQPILLQTQRHFESPTSSLESYDRSFIVSGQQLENSVMPIPTGSASTPLTPPNLHHLSATRTLSSSSSSSPSFSSSSSSFSSSSPLSHFDRDQLNTQRGFDHLVQMESSGPTESVSNFLASRSSATLTSHRSQQPQIDPSATTTATPVFSSTPMQRSLTHNPAMSSFTNLPSSITAATSDPDSVSISVSSSSPTSSVPLPAFTPSSSSSPSSSVRNSTSFAARDPIAVSVTGDRDTIANLNSNDRPTEVGRRIPSNGGTEADDRIHFRLLNNIYFSASARQSHLDDDLGTNLTAISNGSERLLNMNRENSFMMMEDRIAGEDGMEYEGNGPRTSMFTDQGEEFASIVVRSQSDHPESIDEEEDGDDNGADQVTENRRLHSRDMPINLEYSSSSTSNLERPQHAQLSPRSAAALTNMFSDGRTSWPQPILNSSISSDLIALSEGRTEREYNNPYFRRPAPSNPVREISGSLDNAMGTDASRSRSTSTQYDTVRHDYNSQIYLHRSGTGSYGNCGERTPVSVNEAQGDVWPLSFEMYHADGGEFNASHSVENVLKNDSSVYCSRRSNNINICLKLAEPHQTFVLTQFRAKAPTTGFTAPCKEGLIFVSHEPIPLEKTAIFDNMTRERYDEYMRGLNQGPTFGQMLRNYGSKADALIPAAFFQMEGPDETCTLDLTPNRSGRYVVIKLLRSKCTNPLQRPENIDLQYLGLIGYTGARSFASGGLL